MASSWFRVVSCRIPVEICCSSSRRESPSSPESRPEIARMGLACLRAMKSASPRLNATKTGRIAMLLKICLAMELLMSAFRSTAA